MKAGHIRQGLMVKAKVISKGNKDQIESEYIKLRIQSIQDQFVISDFLRDIENENFINEQKIKELEEKNKNNDGASGGFLAFFFIILLPILIYLYYILVIKDL